MSASALNTIVIIGTGIGGLLAAAAVSGHGMARVARHKMTSK